MNKFKAVKIHIFQFFILFFINSGVIFVNQAVANIYSKNNTKNEIRNNKIIVKNKELTSSLSASSINSKINLLAPLAGSDLELTQIKIKNQSLAVKDQFSLEYKLKITNYEGPVYLGIYFSEDDVLDKKDKNATYEKLVIDQKNISGLVELTVPALPDGKYFIIAKIDDQWGSSAIDETDETNNIIVLKQPVEVVSPPVDIMASITGVSADYNFLVVDYNLVNLSDNGVGAWDAKIYISADQMISADDRVVASINDNTYLNAQNTYKFSINEVYLFPYEYLDAGDYYVLIDFNASRTLPETNYENNIGISQQFTIKPYALSLNIGQVHTNPKISSSDVTIPFSLDWTNNGPNSIDGLYFDLKVEITQSENSEVSYHEQWVWLSSGDSETIDIELQMPAWIEGGEALVTFSSEYTNTHSEKLNIIPDYKNAEVILENLSQVFDGNGKEVEVKTVPEGLNVVVFYNGSSEQPVNAGKYKVVAMVKDPQYKGTSETVLEILPATAQIKISGTTVTYNGDPQAVDITTEPVGLPLNVLYNGTETEPVDAGKYNVEVTVADPNYLGKANTEFYILAKEVTVSFSALEHKYNGEEKKATVITSPEDLNYSVMYFDLDTLEKKPVDAGDYLVKVIGSETNFKLTAWATLKITKAKAYFSFGKSTASYNGTEQSLKVTPTPLEVKYEVHYYDADTNEVIPVNAGKYLVQVTANDNNYDGSAWGAFIIEPAIAKIFTHETNVRYDGLTPKTEYTTDPAGLDIIYQYFNLDSLPIEPVNAGKYLVKAIVEKQNYAAEAWGSMIINPAEINFSFSNSQSEYSGSVQNIGVIPSLKDINYTITYWQNGEIITPVKVGEYQVKVNAADKNYHGTAETTFRITPAELKINFLQVVQEYTGSMLNVTVITEPSDVAVKLSYFNSDTTITSPLEAAVYLVKAISADANYSGVAWTKMEITPAIADIVFEELQHKFDGNAKKAMVYTNPAGLNLEVKYDGKDDFPTQAGMYKISASVTDQSFTGNEIAWLEIAKADAEIVVGDLVFANDEPVISVTTYPSGLFYEMSFVMGGDTTSTMPTEPGEYKLIIEIVDENFRGRLIKPMVITGGELLEQEEIFSVYPNPVQDRLSFNLNENDIKVKLIDMNGRLVKDWELTVQKSIDISFAPGGTYFIAVQTPNKTYTKRILKL